MMATGGLAARSRLLSSPPPIRATSSSWTIRTTCWPGERLCSTWAPTARSRTFSMKSLTTLKLTSASRRTSRTSRRASLIFSSVITPWPRSFLNTRSSLSERLSNIKLLRNFALLAKKRGSSKKTRSCPACKGLNIEEATSFCQDKKRQTKNDNRLVQLTITPTSLLSFGISCCPPLHALLQCGKLQSEKDYRHDRKSYRAHCR